MAHKEKILVLDDERMIRRVFDVCLPDFDVVTTSDSESAMEHIIDGHDFFLAFVDIFLNNELGLDWIRKVRLFDDDIYIVIMTGATKRQIKDFFKKNDFAKCFLPRKPFIDVEIKLFAMTLLEMWKTKKREKRALQRIRRDKKMTSQAIQIIVDDMRDQNARYRKRLDDSYTGGGGEERD